MVTVVSTVPHPTVVKEVVCSNCGATLQYVPKDIQSHTYRDYSNTYYIVCPPCGENVFVKRY